MVHRTAATARRQRQRHLRRLRRDLLEDGAIALVLTILIVTVTAGLGVIALIAAPVAGVLLGSWLLERSARIRPAARARRQPLGPSADGGRARAR
jgi:hypothetical protein